MNKVDFKNNLQSVGSAEIVCGPHYNIVKAGKGGGVCTDKFKSLADCVTVHILCRIVSSATEVCFRLCSYDESGNETEIYINNFEKDIDCYFKISHSFDPISLSVYKNAVAFSVSVSSLSDDNEIYINEFYITEGADFVSEVAETVSNITTLENGEKAVLVQQNNGDRITVPLVPKKTLFIGNSILLGMFNSYGMCSTDSKSDYAYHVQQAILAKNPDCTFKKLHGSAFEHSETEDAADNWFTDENIHSLKPAVESFDEDTDLIVIQMTDNVNTEVKISVFNNSVDRFITRIKDMCPKARILWVYGWYNKYNTHDKLHEVCARHAIELVDISGVRSKENESRSGQISINPDGEEIVVRDTWITHPGNKGMRAIADRIIKTLGI